MVKKLRTKFDLTKTSTLYTCLTLNYCLVPEILYTTVWPYQDVFMMQCASVCSLNMKKLANTIICMDSMNTIRGHSDGRFC